MRSPASLRSHLQRVIEDLLASRQGRTEPRLLPRKLVTDAPRVASDLRVAAARQRDGHLSDGRRKGVLDAQRSALQGSTWTLCIAALQQCSHEDLPRSLSSHAG